MMEIIPAILTDDPVELDRLLLLVKNIGATRVHIDILDNTLVAGRTISGWEQLENKNIGLDIDVHFMTSHPIGDASRWAGVQNVSRMIAHIESDDPFSEFAKEMRMRRIEPWIGINLETDYLKLDQYIAQANGVLCLTVYPGEQGRAFLPDACNKIKEFHNAHPNIQIMADGGINKETISHCRNTGVTHAVCGSAIIKSQNPKESYLELLK